MLISSALRALYMDQGKVNVQWEKHFKPRKSYAQPKIAPGIDRLLEQVIFVPKLNVLFIGAVNIVTVK